MAATAEEVKPATSVVLASVADEASSSSSTIGEPHRSFEQQVKESVHIEHLDPGNDTTVEDDDKACSFVCDEYSAVEIAVKLNKRESIMTRTRKGLPYYTKWPAPLMRLSHTGWKKVTFSVKAIPSEMRLHDILDLRAGMLYQLANLTDMMKLDSDFPALMRDDYNAIVKCVSVKSYSVKGVPTNPGIGFYTGVYSSDAKHMRYPDGGDAGPYILPYVSQPHPSSKHIVVCTANRSASIPLMASESTRVFKRVPVSTSVESKTYACLFKNSHVACTDICLHSVSHHMKSVWFARGTFLNADQVMKDVIEVSVKNLDGLSSRIMILAGGVTSGDATEITTESKSGGYGDAVAKNILLSMYPLWRAATNIWLSHHDKDGKYSNIIRNEAKIDFFPDHLVGPAMVDSKEKICFVVVTDVLMFILKEIQEKVPQQRIFSNLRTFGLLFEFGSSATKDVGDAELRRATQYVDVTTADPPAQIDLLVEMTYMPIPEGQPALQPPMRDRRHTVTVGGRVAVAGHSSRTTTVSTETEYSGSETDEKDESGGGGGGGGGLEGSTAGKMMGGGGRKTASYKHKGGSASIAGHMKPEAGDV